jgi:hypothetical protein
MRRRQAWRAEACSVHDYLLDEALKRLAIEAATRFSALVASGDQIPFDVAEQDGPDSLFYRYEPLTTRYIRERENELRSLPAFGPACDAVEEAGVAAPYLESRGETIPAEPAERASRMLTVFVASLWDGCTEFSLDRARLDGALDLLGAEVSDADEAEVLIAPLVGLRMPMTRLELPQGVCLIRADAIEAPIEAMRSEGMERAAWEPQFLALVEQGEGPESAAAAMKQLRELISVMRLFKAGGIGLGPYAFAPTGEGKWRRVATAAPATRPGGYELSEAEGAELVKLAADLESRPSPNAALSWGIARFELGCAREDPLQGLSDHLLALRSVLEGQGPVGASLPMRASALLGDESLSRDEARGRIERALELERSLMSGVRRERAAELAAWLEEGTRRILRQAAMGELGTDLGAAAEETLIAAGLDAGDGAIVGTTSEWETPEVIAEEDQTPRAAWETREEEQTRETPQAAWVTPDITPAPRTARATPDITPAPRTQPNPAQEWEVPEWEIPDREEVEITVARAHDEEETRIMEPIPGEDEIRITATNWLDEVSVSDRTLEWPAAASDIEHRQRIDSPRVRHLFPVPEDADWEVRELDYDHYNRRAG